MQHIAIQRSETLRSRFMADISIYISLDACLDRQDRVQLSKYHVQVWIQHERYPFMWLLLNGQEEAVFSNTCDVNEWNSWHYLTEGTVNEEKLAKFMEDCLLPVLNSFNTHSVVILDNVMLKKLLT